MTVSKGQQLITACDQGFVPWPDADSERFRALGLWTGETFASWWTSLVRLHGPRLAVVDARRRFSYAELDSRVLRLAAGLHGLGVGVGDAVLLQLPNRVEFVEVFLALAWLGARPVMAQPAHRHFELRHFATKSRAVAHVVIGGGAQFDHAAMSHELRKACPTLRHTIVLDDTGDDVALGSLYAEAPLVLPAAEISDTSIALFQLSGGSTDVPKLIARTHADYLYSVRQSVEVCGFDEQTVYLAVLPVAHNFTLSSPGALGVLSAGGTLVLCESPAARDAFSVIQREGVTVTALVPALLPAWLRAASRQRGALASLRVLQVGGARLDPALAARVRPDLGCALQQVFGMAEGLVCYTPLGAEESVSLTTQGCPMSAHDEVRIVDDEDREVDVGEVGHLLARGPYTIRGYYDAPCHNREAFTQDGFYRTGDCVRALPGGALIVEGRAKDQINRGGEKISAPELEAQLCTQPDVELAAVVGVADAHLGERSCAFLVGTPRPASEVRGFLRGLGLAEFKLPDRVEWLSDLPRTPVGKIDKRALRAMAERSPQALPGRESRLSKENHP